MFISTSSVGGVPECVQEERDVIVLLGAGHLKDDYHLWIEAFLPLEARIRTGVEGQAIGAPRQPGFGVRLSMRPSSSVVPLPWTSQPVPVFFILNFPLAALPNS
jgi:hypothetical protein